VISRVSIVLTFFLRLWFFVMTTSSASAVPRFVRTSFEGGCKQAREVHGFWCDGATRDQHRSERNAIIASRG
jgi:hypothetical protein